MKKIEPLKIRVGPSSSNGLFHDSRGDVQRLGQAINAIIDKQNEMIDAINVLIDKEGKT